MKILHVIGQRPEMTGSGVYLQALAKESTKQNHQNYLVAGVPLNKMPELENIPPDCCQYVHFESDHLNFPVTGMSDVMPYGSSLFKELKGERLDAYKTAFGQTLMDAVTLYRPDIIHTHHLLVVTALTRQLFPDLPIVTTCHGTDLRQYHNCDHLRTFVKEHCCRLDRIIALTTDHKKAINTVYDIPLDRIATIPGGYDDRIFNRIPKTVGSKVHILYAGKLNRSKGVPWLLRSLAKIQDQVWHLHMAGSGKGPEYEECLALARNLGQRATIHGYVSHHQLSALMKKAHIQVLPSFFEGLPLVLFEGLASGCRVITNNLPGFDEIFGKAKRKTVDLIQLPELETIDRPYQKDEQWLIDELAERIMEMISTVRECPDFDDPHAEKIASQYTWRKIFKRVESVYLQALGD
ncbi:MAG: glycosyltransferase family 4 protein [Thermodesulfobacteriota bacterium]